MIRKLLLATILFVFVGWGSIAAQEINNTDDPLKKEVKKAEAALAIVPAPLFNETPERQFMAKDFDLFGAQEFSFEADEDEEDPYELISGAYQQYWNGTEKNYPGMTLSVMAWEGTSSWGNFGMFEMGRVPRETYNPSIHDQLLMRTPWLNLYRAIHRSELTLLGIENGETIINDNGENVTDRAKAFAHFVKGISYGFLSMYYEGGYIYEPMDLFFEDAVFTDWAGLKNKAINSLEEALVHSDFSGLIYWIPINVGPELDQDTFKKLIRSYMARIEMLADRDRNIDWSRIIELTDNGIDEDFVVHADGEFWWSRNHSLAQDATWMRTSYKNIGKYDESGNYQDWLENDWADRSQVQIETPDARIMGQTENGPDAESSGTDFSYAGPAAFPPDRGIYFHSMYHHHRWNEMYINGFVGPMPHMIVAEMDLYRAEAYLETGDEVAAIDLINKTRVDRGQLPAATTGHTEEELLDMIYYERNIEIMNTATGLNFFDRRNRGVLTEGTTEEFPASLVSIPFPEHPKQNSVVASTDLTVTIGTQDLEFFAAADEFSIRIAKDEDFTDIVFTSENTSQNEFTVTGLEEETIYYMELTSHRSDGDLSSPELVYLFSTGIPETTVETINAHFVDDESKPLYRVEGTVISPVVNWNGWPSFWLDDGTGGSFVRLHPDHNTFEDVDIQMGDVVNTGGSWTRFWSQYLVIQGSEYDITDTDQDLPEHVEITPDQLQNGLDETANRLVMIRDVTLVDEAQWPVEAGGTAIVELYHEDTEQNFNLVLFVESELQGTDPPEDLFDIRGINAFTGIVSYLESDLGLPVSTEPLSDLPKSFGLAQNYPNPFNPVTVIDYQLPVNSDVKLEVFDVLGRRVSTLVNESMVPAGHHQVTFDASHLASGLYIYRIVAGDFIQTRQLMLVK